MDIGNGKCNLAGDWIKLRASLANAPKLIRMTKFLSTHEPYVTWAAADLGYDQADINESASRFVTLGALAVTWSCAREHGKFVGDDLIMGGMAICDLDLMTGVPGIGAAMQHVGWAVEDKVNGNVIFPNFKEYNVPTSDSDRSKKYRERQKNAAVTRPSRSVTDRHGPSRSRGEERREEEIREEKTKEGEPPPVSTPSAALVRAWIFHGGGLPASQRNHETVGKFFDELIRQGHKPETIEAKIIDPGRDKNQAPWQFQKLYFAPKGSERGNARESARQSYRIREGAGTDSAS